MSDRVTVTPLSPGERYMGYQPPRRSACLAIWAVLATIGLGFSFVVILGLVGSRAGSLEAGPSSLHEKVVSGEGDSKIVRISIEGIIADHAAGGLLGGGGGEGLVKRISDQLDKAKDDDAVKAVILDVDSPGGTVTASDQIYHKLMSFRAEAKKPIVVHQGSLAASGGYYVSAAADEIYAEETTITGSIGVIMAGMNFHDLLKEHGVKDVTITSGPNKDLLSSTAPVRDEHVKILQETVDDMYARFCDVVSESMARRKGQKVDDVRPKVKDLADGRIYTAKQAVALGLVDGIGYFETALAAAKSRGGIVGNAKLVQYRKDPTLGDILSGNVESRLGGVSVRIDAADLARALEELGTPRLLALWRGGR